MRMDKEYYALSVRLNILYFFVLCAVLKKRLKNLVVKKI